jgi:hypothetical protein
MAFPAGWSLLELAGGFLPCSPGRRFYMIAAYSIPTLVVQVFFRTGVWILP